MLELALFAALFFILLAVIVSYLLKAAINKRGIAESSIEKTKLIAIGMSPILSAKLNSYSQVRFCLDKRSWELLARSTWR